MAYSSAAQAEPTVVSLDPVPRGAPIYDPATQTLYTHDKMPNAVGLAVEETVIQRGGTPEQAKKTAQAVGGFGQVSGLGLLIESFIGGRTGALIAGGAIGCDVGMRWGRAYGCVAGGLLGAVGGYFANKWLTSDGSVTSSGSGSMTGDLVKGTSTTSNGVSGVWYTHRCFYSSPNCTTAETNEVLGVMGGYNRSIAATFSGISSASNKRAAALILVDSSLNWASSKGSVPMRDAYKVDLCGMVSYGTGAFPSSVISQCRFSAYALLGTVPGGRGYLLVSENVYGGTADSTPPSVVPTVTSQMINQVPVWAYPWTENLDPRALDKEIDPAVIAQISNEAWKKVQGQPGVVNYDAAAPVTSVTVNIVQGTNPRAKPTMRDLIQPAQPTGTEAVKGGTKTEPAYVPPVVLVGGGSTAGNTGTGSGTGTANGPGSSVDNPINTREVTPTQTEMDSVASKVLSPIQTLINAIPKPTLGTRAVQCPALSIDMRGPNMKRIGLDFRVDTDFHCQLAAKMQTAVQAFMLMIAGLMAWRRFMSA